MSRPHSSTRVAHAYPSRQPHSQWLKDVRVLVQERPVEVVEGVAWLVRIPALLHRRHILPPPSPRSPADSNRHPCFRANGGVSVEAALNTDTSSSADSECCSSTDASATRGAIVRRLTPGSRSQARAHAPSATALLCVESGTLAQSSAGSGAARMRCGAASPSSSGAGSARLPRLPGSASGRSSGTKID